MDTKTKAALRRHVNGSATANDLSLLRAAWERGDISLWRAALAFEHPVTRARTEHSPEAYDVDVCRQMAIDIARSRENDGYRLIYSRPPSRTPRPTQPAE